MNEHRKPTEAERRYCRAVRPTEAAGGVRLWQRPEGPTTVVDFLGEWYAFDATLTVAEALSYIGGLT